MANGSRVSLHSGTLPRIIPLMTTESNSLVEEDEISLIDLLGVLVKHRKFIIILTLAGALGVLGFAIGSLLLPNDKSYYPNYYTPKAIVKINGDSGSGGINLGEQVSGISSLLGLSMKSGGSAFGEAKKYAFSNSFVDRVIEKLDLITLYGLSDSKKPLVTARETYKTNLTISDDSDSGTLEISYKDIDGKLAADIINTVTALLGTTFKEMSTNENVIQKNLLEKELADTKGKVQELEEELKAYSIKYGIYDIGTYTTARAEAVNDLHSQFLAKEMEIKAYRALSNIEDPGYRKLKIEMESLQSNLDNLKNGYSVGGIIVPSEKELPELVNNYRNLTLEYKLQGQIYTSLTQQYELIKLKTSSIPPKFIVYEKAVPPLIKSGPSRGKLCVIVTMAVFFLSIFGAFIIEFIGKIKQDPVEMAKLKGLTE